MEHRNLTVADDGVEEGAGVARGQRGEGAPAARASWSIRLRRGGSADDPLLDAVLTTAAGAVAHHGQRADAFAP